MGKLQCGPIAAFSLPFRPKKKIVELPILGNTITQLSAPLSRVRGLCCVRPNRQTEWTTTRLQILRVLSSPVSRTAWSALMQYRRRG